MPETYPPDELVTQTPSDDPVIASMHYATLALMQRIRPDALLPLGGHPPASATYNWPEDWTWEPGEEPVHNLRKARYLLEVAIAEDEGGEVLENGYPSQTDIVAWINRNFPDTTYPVRALGLVEEVGELCRAIVKRDQGIRGTDEEWEMEIRKELGDIFIKLLDVAENSGFDLATVAMLRWMDIRERDWVRDPQGHGLPETA